MGTSAQRPKRRLVEVGEHGQKRMTAARDGVASTQARKATLSHRAIIAARWGAVRPRR